MAKSNSTPAELTHLHRLTQAEADLLCVFRLLSPSIQDAIAMLINSSVPEPAADDNVVRLRG